MYRAFYQLQRKPFQITTDPEFLWLGEKHREALATLTYGFLENKGFLLLTGDVGTGKTTLINALVESLDKQVVWAMIADPGVSRFDFYNMVSDAFGLPGEIRSKSDFLKCFGRFLHESHHARRTVLLIIDETQRLKHDLLEEIRLLSNIEKSDAKLLTIFFVGQNEVNPLLLKPENRALRERIGITYNLKSLNLAETHRYIRHRLKTAGATRDLFSSGAVSEVFDHSDGAPRKINIICDLVLLYGFKAYRKTINLKIVRKCLEKICFPRKTGLPAAFSSPKPTLATVAVPADRTHAVPKWMAGAAAMMVISAALLFPDLLENGETQPSLVSTRVNQSVTAAAPSAHVVEVPLDPGSPLKPHRATVTATLAGPVESAPSLGPIHPDTKADPGREPSQRRRQPAQGLEAPGTAESQPPATGASVVERAASAPPIPNPTIAGGPASESVSATAAEASAVPEEPDPGDIIDWLMKKKPVPGSRPRDGAP